MTQMTDTDRKFVERAIEAVDLSMVRDWLAERQANCLRIARQRTGDDREGWLTDFVFFSAAKGMIDWTALYVSEAAPDLIIMLAELRQRCEGEICDGELLDRVDAALAAAKTGGQP